jgi:hypothetical protein
MLKVGSWGQKRDLIFFGVGVIWYNDLKSMAGGVNEC